MIHARSLMLSAPNEGLIAKLDLLELKGTTATPVDYKRGQAPKIAEGAYEPERVQLCAQGLVLRENGFECYSGVIYFVASKRRVTILFDDALVERTRQLLADFRRTAAGVSIPAPLVDSPKCPRCSLVGICLPDEVNLLIDSATVSNRTGESPVSPPDDSRATMPGADNKSGSVMLPQPAVEKVEPPRVRKLLPARDDAVPLYVQDQGAMLGKSSDRLTIKVKGVVKAERRLMDVSQVCVFGNVMFTAPALRELSTRGIPVCHFTYGGWFHAMTTGMIHRNVELRIRQFEIAADPRRSLEVAQRFIAGKIRNCRTLLRRHLPKCEKPRLDQLDEFRRRAEVAGNADTLLGLEGMAARVYFGGLFQLLGEHHEFRAEDRNRRPPRDPVNAVLSFVYAMLVKEITIVLQAVGFDPMLGVLHRPRYGRPSLALDIAEEFRSIIADSVMLTVFNNGELKSSEFLERAGAVTLTASGRAAVIGAFERRLSSEVTHPLFGYRLSYRRLLEVQARLLSRTMLGELSEYPSFCTR